MSCLALPRRPRPRRLRLCRAEIIASDVTRDLIVERGQQDMDSEIGRFPRLFRGKESIPGLTWPDMRFTSA